MTSETSLHGDSIALAAGVATADAVLRRLSELAKLNPLAAGLTERAIYRGLKDREKLGSTGLGHGVAIPHFATDDVDDFIVALLTTSAAVDFNGLDGKPSDVFVCIVGPRSQRDRHIKLLSALSKFLSAPGSLDNLRRETDPATIRSLLSPALDIEDEPSGRDRVLFQIFMQNLDHFEDVLNLFSSVDPASITVIETRNAGAYLFSMPLFAAFWSEDSSREGRVILAVVDKQITNNILRQIREITGDPDGRTGILVAVHDLLYVAGSLTF